MTKGYKTILIGLAAALVLSGGAYAGVCAYKNYQDTKSQEVQDTLLLISQDESNVTGLKIHNSTGDYEFSLGDNSVWNMVSGDNMSASNFTLSSIASAMCSIRADRIVIDKAEPDMLSKYGLDDPLTITIVNKDSSNDTIKIGNKFQDKELYYAMKDGRDEIFGVASEYIDKLKAEKDDIKDRYIFDIENSKAVNYLKYIKDGKVIYDIKKDAEGTWQMNAPYKWATVNGASVTSVVTELIRAKSATFIEEGPDDISQYGFDNPSYEIDIADDTHSASFKFGNYYDDEKKFIYAYNNDTKQVSVFNVGDVSCLESQTETVLLNQIHTENLADVTGISFDVNGEHHEMDIDYEVEDFTNAVYKIDGSQIKTDDQKAKFESLFFSFTGIVFEKVDDNPDKDTLKKDPDVKIVYHRKHDVDYTLELFETPSDSKYYYAVADGEYINVLVRKFVIENGIQKGCTELKELF